MCPAFPVLRGLQVLQWPNPILVIQMHKAHDLQETTGVLVVPCRAHGIAERRVIVMPQGASSLRLVFPDRMQLSQNEANQRGELVVGHVAVYITQGPAHSQLAHMSPASPLWLIQHLPFEGPRNIHLLLGLSSTFPDLSHWDLHQTAQGRVAANGEPRRRPGGSSCLGFLQLIEEEGLCIELRHVRGRVLRQLRGVHGALGLGHAALLDAIQVVHLLTVVLG
mmetsp:Transcript_1263/g.1718  ORF Transcript_1263/g.1718 Transcript_1263/m.1718 type:complete len:222 (-) Transcript_1263:124-789(-)